VHSTFVAVSKKPETFMHHYALNVECYTHFTSPIRRYCDLVVHRLLNGSLAEQDRSKLSEYKITKGRGIAEDLSSEENSNPSSMMLNLYSTDRIAGIAAICNSRKDASKSAQDASQHLFLCVFFE